MVIAPGGPKSIDQALELARARLDRLTPQQASGAVRDGALLVDTRYAAQRDRDGLIPGALVVERNELEWRLDPLCAYRLPEAVRHDLQVIVVCNEGYSSSLAAVSLQELGLHRATDLIGGFQAWAEAGLPVIPPAGSTGRAQASGVPHRALTLGSDATTTTRNRIIQFFR